MAIFHPAILSTSHSDCCHFVATQFARKQCLSLDVAGGAEDGSDEHDDVSAPGPGADDTSIHVFEGHEGTESIRSLFGW